MEVLDVAETRALLRSKRYFAAQNDRSAFHIHPLKYAHALAFAAKSEGVRIHEGTRALRASRREGIWEVETPQGRVRAQHLVWCVSSYDRKINSLLGRAVLPVATYIAVTEPLGDRAAAAIAVEAAISDTRRAGDYYRRLPEGRILWGGRITTKVSQPQRLAEMMRRDMVSVYPQLGQPRIDYAWSGLMGYARHRMPIIGQIGEDEWAATAFGGHGLNTTAMAGLLIAEAIALGSDRWRLFSAFGPRWTGGPLGRAGVQLSYWGMQLRDKYEETRAMNGSGAS
jgi:gamma-glutamylputrescine oxidase